MQGSTLTERFNGYEGCIASQDERASKTFVRQYDNEVHAYRKRRSSGSFGMFAETGEQSPGKLRCTGAAFSAALGGIPCQRVAHPARAKVTIAQRKQENGHDTSVIVTNCQSGGHGDRTRNPLRGTSFPMKPLAIRLPSRQTSFKSIS